jgi:aspartyl-tRNA(Asn)/glutamyl-tRNA(Gln) amidotransferase subunit B
VLDPEWVKEIEASLPELPDQKKARFTDDFGLSAYDAGVLVAERETAAYFETVLGANGACKPQGEPQGEPMRDPKLAANWVTSELFGQLNRADKTIADSPISAEALGGLIDLIADDTLSTRSAKDVFIEMFNTGRQASEIVEEKGLKQITDTGEIETIVDTIIAANPGQAAQARDNPKAIGWFVGQVMKQTGGQANPKAVNELLRKKLGGSS